MNFKDKLIKRLVDVGKKHRILVYPMLVLVAIISAISHAIYWGKGNGRKLVASVVIVALLITQSLFLTSSADTSENDPVVGTEQEEGTEVGVEPQEDNTDGNPSDINAADGSTDDGATSDGNVDDGISADVNTENVNSNGEETLNQASSNESDGDDEIIDDNNLLGDGESSELQNINYYIVYTDATGSKVTNMITSSAIDENGTATVLSGDEVVSDWSGYAGTGAFSVEGPYLHSTGTAISGNDVNAWADDKEIEGNVVKLYYNVSRTSYTITIDGNGGTAGESSTVTRTVNTTTGAVDEIVSYTPEEEGYGFKKTGYIYKGVGTSPIDVSLSNLTLYAQWEGQPYTVIYNTIDPRYADKIDDNGETSIQKEYKFGDSVDPLTDSDIKATSAGYVLDGWKDTDGVFYSKGITLANNELAIQDTESESGISSTGKTLTAVWKYRDVNLSFSDGSKTITAQYGDTIDQSIVTIYADETAGNNNFSYTMADASSSALEGLGISVQVTQTGGNVTGFKLSGTLSDIDEEGVSIVITISDSNKAEGDTSGAMTQTLTLISNKRQVTMDPSTVKDATGNPIEKNYNGLTSISTSGTCDVLNKVGSDKVNVTFAQAAELYDPNVGTGKPVILSNVNLAGDDAGKYVLYNNSAPVAANASVTLDGVATVNASGVPVTIRLADDSASTLFGAATPVYTLEITDTSKLSSEDATIYAGCSTDSERESFIASKMGFSGWSCARTLYSPVKSYDITPVFSTGGTYNYTANVSPSKETFTVTRDSGEGHYEFDRDAVNGIYPGLNITATSGYDKVRIVTDGDISEGADKGTVEGKFKTSVNVPDGKNQTIQLQMLNSATGAITEIVTLTGISVDSSCPELKSFSVTPNKTLINEPIFNGIPFGAYYHTQTVEGSNVESVSINFVYSSKDSDCKTLYYTFTDENGNELTSGSKQMTKNAAGDYEASMTIGTGVYGKLSVYAVNEPGISSAISYIRLNDSLTKMDNYYEWMVENSITSSDIVVTDSDGAAASLNSVWYNSLTYSTAATDNESGLQKIDWHISGPSGNVSHEENAGYELASSKTEYGKVISYTFSGKLDSEELAAGSYYVSGTLYDNAGNSIELSSKGPYLLDCKKPVIIDNTSYSPSGYDNTINFTFTATEGEDESGIATVKLYKIEGSEKKELKSWGDEPSYSYEITENGTYQIEATDIAGNVNDSFTKTITNLSTVVPDTPVITVDGEKGNDPWYITSSPKVNIKSQTQTSDGVHVTTYYSIAKEGTTNNGTTNGNGDYTFDLTDRGEITITAWSMSDSGIKSEEAKKTVYVDTEKPDLFITESSADESGNLTINFKVTDTLSGVNTSKIFINGKLADVTNNDGVISGSFSASSASSFEITAEDIAGNKADTLKFVPMGLEVSPVMDIEDTSAYLTAQVVKGTYDIAECYIQYKKSTASTYETALANKYDNERGKQIDYTFKNLTPDTVYDYKVYASTLTSKEVKTYEGSFRTSSKQSTGVVYGSASYDSNLADGSKTYPIYVALYSGNTYIKSAKIDSADDNDYKFTDIADGSYRVVATNGVLSKETSVTLEKGTVTYPSTYAADGGINLVLSGLSTEVVLQDDTVALTVDGLEKIYNTGLYNGNVTPADMEVVRQGGTIKITLYASYMDVSSVSDTTETIFEDRLGNEAVIERYINIEVVKEVRNTEGELVNGTPSNITTLAEPVTLSFPLGSLAGQNIHVASLHGSGSDYSFKSWVNGSEAVLSTNFITITTDRFSVYALYRYEVKDIYYTVKWLDGDGNVMKTETVKSGESATPPTATPTKKETDKYTYAFEGWDTDYSAITGDTIISAWFTANKKVDDTDNKNGNNNGNGDNNGGNTDNGNNNNNNNNSGSGNKNNDNGNKTNPTPTTVNPGTSTTPSGDGAGDISTSPVRYTYMGSASSPKTGDATPIAVVMVVMLTSAAGMVVLRKKAKENE